VTSYNNVVGYRRFGGPCCLHLQGEEGPMKRGIATEIPDDFYTEDVGSKGPPKRRYPTPSLHNVITHKTASIDCYGNLKFRIRDIRIRSKHEMTSKCQYKLFVCIALTLIGVDGS
jgi:hypothetical protein